MDGTLGGRRTKAAVGRSGRSGEAAASLRAQGLLRGAGLRPTRQRIALAAILFGEGHRHVAAEAVYEEALAAGADVSLATVYNTLNQFTAAGLLRELPVSGTKSFFDTNTTPHHHFYEEGASRMIDVPAEAIGVTRLPEPPHGMEITAVEVMLRLKRKD
ncbi:transcriptional repressor [Siculibacillus lacustris]|uniref:Ferric uptake regulation protein n=1 Tax=Siculibacillus lacustris TaxID=1549641 RepID=A0A4Q9VKN2_9HYPH|nr:Fur family transcriptional regulator [Siculibacillus lacustris]TBW35978.1 transcriptional repressor [Siculibacillus lacustris]